MEESRNRAGCWDRRMKRGREREQKKGVGQKSAAYLSIFTVQHAILFCDGSSLPYARDFLNAFWRIKAANPGSTQLHLISFPFGSEQFRSNQWMAIDAIFKIPAQLSPTKKKKPTLSDLAAEEQSESLWGCSGSPWSGQFPGGPFCHCSSVTTGCQMQQVKGYGGVRDCFQEVKTQ